MNKKLCHPLSPDANFRENMPDHDISHDWRMISPLDVTRRQNITGNRFLTIL